MNSAYLKNKYRTLTGALVATTALAESLTCQGALVAHWKLDETSGTTAADSAGGDNTGTLNNGPSWVTGTIGGGLDFDGTDDYLNAPLTTIPTGVGSRTVALWFNADNVSTQGAKLFAYGDGWDPRALVATTPIPSGTPSPSPSRMAG